MYIYIYIFIFLSWKDTPDTLPDASRSLSASAIKFAIGFPNYFTP